MAYLSIDVSGGSPPVLRVRGELDVATADQLGAALTESLAIDPALVVDMAEVTFVDAAGLRAILQVAERRDGGGALTLVNAGRVARLLELVGLRDLSSLNLIDGCASHGR
jgi:anti-anti-sigma factor